MNYYLSIGLLLFALGGVFSAQRQIQMFQQNSYFPSRYFKWLKSSKSSSTYVSILFMVAALCINSVSFVFVILAVSELIVRIIKQQKNHKHSIKKLVYTARVKRLIVTLSLLYILLLFLSVFPLVPSIIRYLFAAVTIVFSHFPQIPIFVSYFINSPFEKAISNGFIKEAKKILNQNKNLLVIGVTGSFGKTSVKFMLNRILSEKYNTVATPESFNTPMGVVRTVREKVNPSTEIFIAEMGAKNIGDIKELCELANPTLGIISAVGPQHLETFKTVENVADTKFELADWCLSKNSGKVYVNFSSENAKEKALTYKNENIISYGNDGSLATANDISVTKNGTEFTVNYKDHSFKIVSKLLGIHNVINLLGAIAIALDLGVSESQIKFAVSSIKAPPHRLEIKPFIFGSTLIDDAYNSNPVGSTEAVKVLGSFADKKRILVTPGLIELGDKEYDYNFALGEVAAENCDIIILVGKNRSVPISDGITKKGFDKENLFVAESFKDAMKILQNITDKNTIVLFENDLPDNYAG